MIRQSRLTSLSMLAFTHARLTLFVTACALAVFVSCAFGLRIDGDFVKLLPDRHPTAQRFLATLERKGGSGSTLLLVVESNDSSSNRRLVDELTRRFERLSPLPFESVQAGPGEVRDFYRNSLWLFARVPELERIDCEISREFAQRSGFDFGLDEPCDAESATTASAAGPDAPPSAAATAPESAVAPSAGDGGVFARLEREVKAREREYDRFPSGYFQNAEGTTFVIVLRSSSKGMGEGGSDALLAQARETVDAAQRAVGASTVRVGLAGDIPNAIAERQALLDDITVVSAVAIVIILAAIVLHFRSFRSLLHIGGAVALGSSFAFAVAALAFGHLNAATSFLGSIIIGNGINPPIIYLSRYRELRLAGSGRQEAVREAALSCQGSTGLAALAAAGAYGALLLTSFRGFSEFGLIGGLGMLGCWFATFVVCPASIGVWEGPALNAKRTAKAPPRPARWPVWTVRGRLPLIAGALGLTLGAAWLIPGYLRDPWEYDFSKLRSRVSSRAGAGHFSSRADRVLGSRGSPLLLLADDAKSAPLLAERVLKQDAAVTGGQFVRSVQTAYDVLGGTPSEVTRKLELLGAIRENIDRALPRLSQAQHDLALRYRPPEALHALGPADLPLLLRQQFSERDGRFGTPVYVTLDPKISQSRGENLLKIDRILQGATLADAQPAPNASRASVFAAMIRSMEHDGPLATVGAFAAVILVTTMLTRRLAAIGVVLASLLMGVLWTVGVAAHFAVKLNFLNFVALPLTFGIGVEYAINLYERIRLLGGDIVAGLRSVASGIALCSFTTIVGYGALLFADNRALNSFGLYAIAGEFSCVVSALLVMPAILAYMPRTLQAERRDAG